MSPIITTPTATTAYHQTFVVHKLKTTYDQQLNKTINSTYQNQDHTQINMIIKPYNSKKITSQNLNKNNLTNSINKDSFNKQNKLKDKN